MAGIAAGSVKPDRFNPMNPPETSAVLRLDLDHVGCIARSLDDAAARWQRLGFRLTPQSRQQGAVPGLAGMHPWATANRCVILRNTYLELIGMVDAGAFNPWARFMAKAEGLHILALRCDEADTAYSTLSARSDALLPPVPRARVLDVDGEPRTMRFRNIFSRDEAWPEARYLVIEHQTPDYVWQPRYQRHDNGACDLVAVSFVADDPLMLVPRLQALGAEVVAQDAAVVSAKLPGRGALRVMSSDRYGEMYGAAPRTGLCAMTISFENVKRTLDSLAKRGLIIHASSYGHWTGPEDANGFVMHLVQDNEYS